MSGPKCHVHAAIRLLSGTGPRSLGSPSASPCCLYVVAEPTDAQTRAPMSEGGREGGERPQRVRMRTVSIGLRGISRSVALPSTRYPKLTDWVEAHIGETLELLQPPAPQ